jgi:hypothetical protein
VRQVSASVRRAICLGSYCQASIIARVSFSQQLSFRAGREGGEGYAERDWTLANAVSAKERRVGRPAIGRNSPHHPHNGESAAARKSYQDFLTLWKDADSDIPILKQAKAEYARLH